MKIGIMADTHDNMVNMEKAIDWLNKNEVTELIHCGDLCAPSILKNILGPKFKGKIHMVFGNVEDRENTPLLAKDFKQINHYGDMGEIEIDNIKIGIVHYPDEGKKLAETQKYDLVFYGHNHKPWEEAVGKTQLINPGTLAGLFNKATFAVYDTENNKLELKILELI